MSYNESEPNTVILVGQVGRFRTLCLFLEVNIPLHFDFVSLPIFPGSVIMIFYVKSAAIFYVWEINQGIGICEQHIHNPLDLQYTCHALYTLKWACISVNTFFFKCMYFFFSPSCMSGQYPYHCSIAVWKSIRSRLSRFCGIVLRINAREFYTSVFWDVMQDSWCK